MLIDFSGTQIPKKYGRLAKIHAYLLRGDVVAAGLLVSFAATADSLLEKLHPADPTYVFTPSKVLQLAAIYGACAATMLAMQQWSEQKSLRKFFAEETLKTKAIDTKPDLNKPYDDSEYYLAALAMKESSSSHAKTLGVIMGGCYALISAGLIAMKTDISAVYIAAGILRMSPLLLPPVVSSAISDYQWKKVEAGEWQITDKGPPPEPIRKTAPLGRLQTAER